MLLEQDQQQNQQQGGAQPEQDNANQPDPSEISSEVEKVGKKMGSQVEMAEEELFNMSKNLINVFKQAFQADGLNLNDHINLKQIIDKLNKASSSADAKSGLPAIEEVIKSYTEDTTKKPQPFNF